MKFFNPIIILLLSLIYSFFFEMTFSVNDLFMFTPLLALRYPMKDFNPRKYLMNNDDLGQILGLFLSGKGTIRIGKSSSTIYVSTFINQENVLAHLIKFMPTLFKNAPITKGNSCYILSRSFKTLNTIFIDKESCKDLNYLVSCIIATFNINTMTIWLDLSGHKLPDGSTELSMVLLNEENRQIIRQRLADLLGYEPTIIGNSIVISPADHKILYGEEDSLAE